ncbi:hypothetical protein ACHHYP_02852 [Achlya hypogyna]|uniref:Uncharacterized protein n=1 Tax=Achlya hypogyna TaxID=1202772 RepID=A0A1V9Z5P0_ACHHY|nr:hypothetical protein ACHHYP_02852 [Achlya hypogyna]
MGTQPVANEETIRAAFAAFDVDESGAIDAGELGGLVESLGGILSQDELAAALRLLDKDGDGTISYDEFAAWWARGSEDLDGDGQAGELEKALGRLKELGQQRYHVDIHTACWRGDLAVVSRLLEQPDAVHDRDITEYGDMNSPLHYAAYTGSLPLCQLLVQHKAKVNATNALGCTPLFFAAQQERLEVVKYLLEQGADAKIRESEMSAVDVTSSMAVLDLFKAIKGEKPSPPQRPEATAVRPTSITIAWATGASKLNESLPISGFKVKVVAAGAKPILRLGGPYPLQMTLEKLQPDTEYAIQVAAVSLHGASDYCAPVSVATLPGCSYVLR